MAQESILHDELHLMPWDLAVEDPANPTRYRKPDLEAQARWRALMEAVTALP